MKGQRYAPLGEATLQQELDRKVLDQMEKLDLSYQTGQITEQQLSTGMQTLYGVAFGLTSDRSLQEVMDVYKPTMTAPNVYFTHIKKGQVEKFVIWKPGTDVIRLHDGYSGEVKEIEIPPKSSAHATYNKILEILASKGWYNVNEPE